MAKATGTAALEFAGVTLDGPDGPLISDLSLRAEAGRVTALAVAPAALAAPVFGLAAGVVRPGAGRVKVLGQELEGLSGRGRARLQSRVGCYFETGALISNQDLAGNLALPLRFHTALAEAAVAERVRETAGRFGLTALLGALPGELDREQRLGAALARAVILGPELLLLQNPPGFIREKARAWADQAGRETGSGAAGRPAVVFTRSALVPAESEVTIQIKGNGAQT